MTTSEGREKKQPIILLTNDDGIHAPGIHALYEALRPLGRLVVVAPDRDNSAVSHSLTIHRPLRARELKPDFYAVNGTPTDCVTIGIGKILAQPPGLVASGINAGGNLGDDLTYSGTVSAAMEGTMLGIPSIALSLAGEEPFRFETVIPYAREIAGLVLGKGLPRDTLLNVNVPNLRPGEIEGVEFTRQGRRIYDGAIKETFDPWGRKHFWIGGGTPLWEEREETDAQAVLSGKISITPIHLDLTNYEALSYLNNTWKNETIFVK